MMFWILFSFCPSSHIRVADTPNSPSFSICHVPRSLTVCPTPPSVFAPQYSFRPAVIDLVPSSILGSYIGYGNTCLFGYCVRFKFSIVHVMQNVITIYLLLPPHMIFVNKSAGFSSPSMCVVSNSPIATDSRTVW